MDKREEAIRAELAVCKSVPARRRNDWDRRYLAHVGYLLEKVERLEGQIEAMATDRLDCGDPLLGAIRGCPFMSITFRYNPDARELAIVAAQGPSRKSQRELSDRDIMVHRESAKFVADQVREAVQEAYDKKELTDA